jgi:hypothetical protein
MNEDPYEDLRQPERALREATEELVKQAKWLVERQSLAIDWGREEAELQRTIELAKQNEDTPPEEPVMLVEVNFLRKEILRQMREIFAEFTR